MDEVKLDPGEPDGELAERVQARLMGPPVVALTPVRAEVPEVGDVCPVAPAGSGSLVGPACSIEAVAEVPENRGGDADRERAKGAGRVHGGSRGQYARVVERVLAASRRGTGSARPRLLLDLRQPGRQNAAD
jgi:hypothetical protein